MVSPAIVFLDHLKLGNARLPLELRFQLSSSLQAVMSPLGTLSCFMEANSVLMLVTSWFKRYDEETARRAEHRGILIAPSCDQLACLTLTKLRRQPPRSCGKDHA